MPIPDHVVPILWLRRLWLTLGWLLVVLIIYLSLMPGPVPFPGKLGDKLQHALAYGVLMVWFANLYPARNSRIGYACGFILLGIALEFVQRWTGYRSFETADMVADAVGVMLGWILAPPRLPSVLQLAERVLWREPGR